MVTLTELLIGRMSFCSRLPQYLITAMFVGDEMVRCTKVGGAINVAGFGLELFHMNIHCSKPHHFGRVGSRRTGCSNSHRFSSPAFPKFGCSLLLCASFHCKQESPEHTGQACAKREHAATKAGELSRCEQMQGARQKTWQTRGKGRSTIDFLASCARAFVVSRRRGDSPRPERPQHSEVTLWSPLSSSPRSHC